MPPAEAQIEQEVFRILGPSVSKNNFIRRQGPWLIRQPGIAEKQA